SIARCSFFRQLLPFCLRRRHFTVLFADIISHGGRKCKQKGGRDRDFGRLKNEKLNFKAN
ncbi:MAG: hypothetical protein II680_10615, partial [Clostridia bacterium]|nr:hypothetical protein [Clostridia bacterium]